MWPGLRLSSWEAANVQIPLNPLAYRSSAHLLVCGGFQFLLPLLQGSCISTSKRRGRRRQE